MTGRLIARREAIPSVFAPRDLFLPAQPWAGLFLIGRAGLERAISLKGWMAKFWIGAQIEAKHLRSAKRPSA